uniref:Uncharacterized protein n=1 Tax=Romanomermis culicivorax TaxID=13658 RepID=A0A915I5M1_ROMCU
MGSSPSERFPFERSQIERICKWGNSQCDNPQTCDRECKDRTSSASKISGKQPKALLDLLCLYILGGNCTHFGWSRFGDCWMKHAESEEEIEDSVHRDDSKKCGINRDRLRQQQQKKKKV